MEDGVKYQFNSLRLKMFVDQKKASLQRSNQKVTQTAIREQLAEKTFVSPEAIKNWMYGNNAPSDLEQVKTLAEYFDVDYHQLLKEEKEMTNTTEIKYDLTNDVQKQYTRNIIRSIFKKTRELLEEIEEYAWEFSNIEGGPEVFFSEDNKEKVLQAYHTMDEMQDDVLKELQYAMLEIPEKSYLDLREFLGFQVQELIKCTANPDIADYSTEEELSNLMGDLDFVNDLWLNDCYSIDDILRNQFAEYIVK